ncbi:hypothetical protein [Gimesia maris]|uniref:hypothetical protein n=1 Tax=Gimesia maris TaxID=122 RepID=UPI0030DB1792|tara:strand:- start:160085 stop:161833 length:1749 start_codon:yes stop_codon:yes gene_type:complete
MSQRLAFLIGVTGHRKLGEENRPAIKSAVRKIFTDLHEKYPQTSFLLLSPLAEGADRLVAEVALELAADDSFQATIELVVPLPWLRAVCENLLHRTGERSEFDGLLNQATQIIEMPLVEGITAEEIVNSEEARAKQYREVGRFIARHSQMLIALWDGVREPEGGTARVIRWQQEGADAPFIKTQNSLDEPECGPVYHIAVPREHSKPELKAGERNTLYPKHGRDTDKDKDKDKVESYFHNMWSSINDFNRDISVDTTSFQSRVSQSKDWVILEQHQSQLYEQHQRLLSLYAAADAAALDNQKKKNRAIGGLFFLVGVAVVCFELYTHLLINWWELLIAYIVFLSAGVGLHRFVTRKKYHDKFIDYRSLAEALRVQFFWRLAGLPLTVSDHYLRTVRSELDWIRQAVRSSQLLTQAHSSLEQEYVQQNQKQIFNLIQKRWVEDQLNYYERTAQKNKETAHRWEWWITLCFRTAISLAVVMLLIHLKTEKMNHILAVLVFIAAAGAALAHEFSEKAAFSVLARRYKWMHSLFATAHKRLAENVESSQYEAAQEIIQLLGEDALIENADWVIQTRHRQPELPAPG